VLLADNAVTANLRAALAQARAAGATFVEAWPVAVAASAAGGAWEEVFEDTRWAWEDAYLRAGESPRWVAVLAEEVAPDDALSGYAPNCGRNYNDRCPGARSFGATGATNRLPATHQEFFMPATVTTTTDAPARTTKDPDATALAAAARDLARAAGLKSAYTSGEGREVLDRFTVERNRGTPVITKDGGDLQRIKLTVLRGFVAGEKDDDSRVAAKLTAALARELKGMLYGRRLACFLITRAA
jgi:hypothetical protein